MKKLLIDLWASATSHFVVAEWMPYMPGWVEPVLVIVLTIAVAVLLFRATKSRPQREAKPQRVFSLSLGPNGDIRMKWSVTKPKDSPKETEVQS